MPGDEVPLTRIRNQPRILAALNKTAITIEWMLGKVDQVTVEAKRKAASIEIAESGAVMGVVRLECVHAAGSALARSLPR